MGRSGTYINQSTGYKAFIPAPLPPQPPLKLDEEINALLAQANLALARLDGLAFTLPNTDLFIAMYVKREALLSSQIEGTQASLEDVLEFESGLEVPNVNDVKEVINYIKALNYGIDRLKKFPMSLRLIKELHEILLHGTRGNEKTPGEFRRSQNWIGPASSTIKNAVFVPPPPHELAQALSSLEKYMHEGDGLPDLINCALIHYQFETIHPFLDGNGRVGRLLITFYLFWKGDIQKPLLYMSYYLKKNRQEYYDRLMLVRNNGDYEQWVKFFLKGITETTESEINDTKKILELQNECQKLLWEKKISFPLAGVLLNQLFYTPIVSISEIQKIMKISFPTASSAIEQFVNVGILNEITGKKRAKRFAFAQYLNIITQGTKPL